MPTCAHCGADIDDEEAYLDHLASEHEGELGRIERRRVADRLEDESGGIPTGPAVLGVVLLVGVAIVAYVLFVMDTGAGAPADGEPGALHSAHEHGTLEMVVLGERVDFSQPRYQLQNDRFHFEERDGRVWHTHATGVTLAWAMDTLGIQVSEGSVTYRGTTYRDASENYSVRITVDGEPVDPSSYVLQGVGDGDPARGDSVRIVVARE